jgi:hypothetical protein
MDNGGGLKPVANLPVSLGTLGGGLTVHALNKKVILQKNSSLLRLQVLRHQKRFLLKINKIV